MVLDPGPLKAGFSMHQIPSGCAVKINQMQNKVDFLKMHSRPNTTDPTKYSWDKGKDDGNGHSNSGSSCEHPWQGCLAYSLPHLPIEWSRGKPEVEMSLFSGITSHHLEINGWRASRDEVCTLFQCHWWQPSSNLFSFFLRPCFTHKHLMATNVIGWLLI